MTNEDLRADAARNRELILAAAREEFAARGLDVSLRQIASRAGVGEPTVRRRFTSKDDLIAAAFEDKVGLYADLAAAAVRDPDPAAGLRSFLEQVARMQLVDRGFAEVLTMTFPASIRCERERRRAYQQIQELIAHGKRAGSLREDFVAEDIVLLLLAHAGVVAGTGRLAPAFSARLLAYLLQAFASPGSEPLPPAPSAARVYKALLTLHE
jgi:AcrR family transcriptional regulator